jgi:ATP-dependent Lon protease
MLNQTCDIAEGPNIVFTPDAYHGAKSEYFRLETIVKYDEPYSNRARIKARVQTPMITVNTKAYKDMLYRDVHTNALARIRGAGDRHAVFIALKGALDSIKGDVKEISNVNKITVANIESGNHKAPSIVEHTDESLRDTDRLWRDVRRKVEFDVHTHIDIKKMKKDIEKEIIKQTRDFYLTKYAEGMKAIEKKIVSDKLEQLKAVSNTSIGDVTTPLPPTASSF